MKTHPIIVREVSRGWWSAIQQQGSAGLPVTVADGKSSPELVLHSIRCRKAVGWIAADVEVIVEEARFA